MLYLAGPLFSTAEQAWLRSLKETLIAAGHGVRWPFELFREGEIAAWGKDAPLRIMERCRDALDGCDAVVAWLDGTQVDDGTAWETGYAYAKGKPVYGLRTDSRQAGDTRHSVVNAMIQGSCRTIVRSVAELLPVLDALPND